MDRIQYIPVVRREDEESRMARDLSKLLGGVKLNGATVVPEPVPHPQHYIYT